MFSKAIKLYQSNKDLWGKFLFRLGELHIVFAHLRSIGGFIENSGVDDLWVKSGIYGYKHVTSILNCKHMKRALDAHEISLLVLYQLYFEQMISEYPTAFCKHEQDIFESVESLSKVCSSTNYEALSSSHSELQYQLRQDDVQNAVQSFETSRKDNYEFQALRIYMRMVERLLLFIHASRSKNWMLHLASGEELVKDFVSNDRLNYRRLMPVYLADMQEVKTSDSEIWEYLGEGNLSVTKSKIPFTSIGVDHAGEQVNKILKSDGGLCGISSNENARTRLLLIAPIIAQITEELKSAGRS